MLEILLWLALIPLAISGAVILFQILIIVIGIVALPFAYIFEQIEKFWSKSNERN